MFMDGDNYKKFVAGEKDYTAALTGADVENAEAGRTQNRDNRCIRVHRISQVYG